MDGWTDGCIDATAKVSQMFFSVKNLPYEIILAAGAYSRP